MADELTSQGAGAAPVQPSSNDGQAVQASERTDSPRPQRQQSAERASDSGQPAQDSTPSAPPDVVSRDDFKKYQAARDRREHELQMQYQQMQKQQQSELQQLRESLWAMEEAGLDDYDKVQKRYERLQKENQELLQQEQQRREMAELYQQRNQSLQELAEEFELTEQSEREELWQTQNYKEALAKARELRDAKLLGKRKDDEARQEANRPDLGGVRAPAGSSDLLSDINRMKKEGSLTATALWSAKRKHAQRR